MAINQVFYDIDIDMKASEQDRQQQQDHNHHHHHHQDKNQIQLKSFSSDESQQNYNSKSDLLHDLNLKHKNNQKKDNLSVSIENVAYSYKKNKPVLKDITLFIPEGTVAYKYIHIYINVYVI